MFDKLEGVEKRYEEINKLISDPEVIANQNEWKALMKEHSEISEVVEIDSYQGGPPEPEGRTIRRMACQAL